MPRLVNYAFDATTTSGWGRGLRAAMGLKLRRVGVSCMVVRKK